ncbi:MAG TPA: helix-turn-helix transcriptional regulator [Streptosporangiaceae bacterium]|nr:helix-turn-helix transcriptional regulator [Streptosporangiaceae bacterium]
MADFGGELRRLLAQQGMSLNELARRAPCDPGYLSKVARGQKRASAEMAGRFDKVLGAGGRLAALVPLAPGKGDDDAGDGTEPWDLAAALTRSPVSSADLGFMERTAVRLAASYPFTPPGELVPEVRAMLRHAREALQQPQPTAVRIRAVRVAGTLCGVAGQLADDMGRHSRAAGYFDAGEIAGAEIGDSDLIAWILAVRSLGLYFRGDCHGAAGLLDRAEGAGAGSSPRRRAWLAALAARSHAASPAWPGRDRQVMASLDCAHEHLASAATPPGGTEFFDRPRLAGVAGTTLLLLRDTRRARELLGDALACRSPADVKGRALLTLDLAGCSAADGEPEQAAQLCAEALDMASGGSAVQPVMAQTQAVAAALRSWDDVRAVRDLEDRLTAIPAPPATEG